MAVSLEQFVDSLSITGLMTAEELKAVRDGVATRKPPLDVESLAKELVKAGKLTMFQANAIYKGKAKGLVCGEYVILEKIGAGGMGQVFKARHKRMNRIVAVKLLAPHAMVGDKQKAVKRFYQEVETAARLVHPNIVIAHDAGEANGLHYLVMEHVAGQDLSTALKPDKKLPLDQALGIVLQAARGLEYAHSQGVVHRDIKPSNLLMDTKGVVKILDMGLARVEDALTGADRAAGAGLTQSGEIMGTVDYMAPEQARNTRDADARADIYSLGCTLFRLATGRVVFEGETLVDKILGHYEKPIPSLAKHCEGVSPRLKQAFDRMLAKKPEDRFASMSEVIAELEACRADVPEEDHAPLVTDEPVAEHGIESFLSKASSVSSKQKSPLPPVAQRSLNSGGSSASQKTSGEPSAETKLSKSRIALFACGGLAALILIGALIALLTQGKSSPAPAEPSPIAKVDSGANETSAGKPAATTAGATEVSTSPTTTATLPSPVIQSPTNVPEPAVASASPSVTPAAIPPEGIDLLRTLDLKRDVVEGEWNRDDTALVLPMRNATGKMSIGRVQFPSAPPLEYDLHIEAETEPLSDVSVGLVVGKSRTALSLSQKQRAAQFGPVDGNPLAASSVGFGPGKAFKIVCVVRAARVTITLDDHPVIEWSGDPQQLTARGTVVGPDPTRLSLYGYGGLRITACELLPPGGQSRRPPREGIDLLKLVDLKRDVAEGTWTFEGPALVAHLANTPNRLQFDHAPPAEYDLHIETETLGSSRVGIGVVVGSSRAVFYMDQQNRLTGFGHLDGKAPVDKTNPTYLEGAAGLGPGKPMSIVCEVRPATVQIKLNGQRVVDWKGDPQQLSLSSQIASADKSKLFLYAMYGARFTRFELLPPGGTPRARPSAQPVDVVATPARSGVRVNLLRLIDPKRDSLGNKCWLIDRAGLVQAPGGNVEERLVIPFAAPREYELRVAAIPLNSAGGRFTVGMVVGPSRQVSFVVSRNDNTAGLEAVAGKTYVENETTVTRLSGLVQGQPMTIACQVRSAGIHVMLNGRRVVDWTGDVNQLSTYGYRAIKDNSKLFLSGADGGASGSFRITKLELIPLGDSAHPIPSTDAVAAVIPKVQEAMGQMPKSPTAMQYSDAAARLHEQAAEAPDDALRYALLTEAVKMATAGDDFAMLNSVIEDLARCFDTDSMAILTSALGDIAARVRPAGERKELLFKFLEAGETQIAAERYDTANLFVKSAAAMVAKMPDAELKKEVHNRELEADEGRKLFSGAQKARQSLATAPDDADAQGALGHYLSIARLDWPAALGHFVKANLAEPRDAAKLESQFASDNSRAADIGTAWLDAAEKAPLPAKAAYLEHARTWLARGAATLKGAALTKTNARFKKVDSDARRAVGTAFVKRHPLRAASIGGRWYQFFNEKLAWQQAKDRCESLGGTLVCLETLLTVHGAAAKNCSSLAGVGID